MIGVLELALLTVARTPAPIAFRENVLAIDAGSEHVCVLTSDEHVSCFESWRIAQWRHHPDLAGAGVIEIGAYEGRVQLAVGSHLSCALAKTGVACWSDPAGERAAKRLVVPMAGIEDALRIDASDMEACALAKSGQISCWRELITPPVLKTSIHDAIDLCMGDGHGCALTRSGDVHCFGNNNVGQVGNEDTALTGASAISCGSHHSCAIKNGEVWCWGGNFSHQLGVDTGVDTISNVPVRVPGLAEVRAIDSASTNTCALLDSGISCWGVQIADQLGAETTEERLNPIAIPDTQGTIAVATGELFVCAIDRSHRGVCWGRLDGEAGRMAEWDLSQPDEPPPGSWSGRLAARLFIGGGRRISPDEAKENQFELGGRANFLFEFSRFQVGPLLELRSADFGSIEPSGGLELTVPISIFDLWGSFGAGYAWRRGIEDGPLIVGTVALGFHQPFGGSWSGTLGIYGSVRRSIGDLDLTEFTGGVEIDPYALVLLIALAESDWTFR